MTNNGRRDVALAWLSLLERLGKHGRMYFNPFEYKTAVAFLSGYDVRNVETAHWSPLDEFREALIKQIGHHCSLQWAALFRQVNAGISDEELTLKLLNELSRFIQENL